MLNKHFTTALLAVTNKFYDSEMSIDATRTVENIFSVKSLAV